MMFLTAKGGVGSILTPGIIQSSRGKSEKCSSPVGLSVGLVGACYSFSVVSL